MLKMPCLHRRTFYLKIFKKMFKKYLTRNILIKLTLKILDHSHLNLITIMMSLIVLSHKMCVRTERSQKVIKVKRKMRLSYPPFLNTTTLIIKKRITN